MDKSTFGSSKAAVNLVGILNKPGHQLYARRASRMLSKYLSSLKGNRAEYVRDLERKWRMPRSGWYYRRNKWKEQGYAIPIAHADKNPVYHHEFCCYHVTTGDRLPSIIRNGLEPNAEPSWFNSKTPYVMLSLYPYWWLYKNRQAWGLPEVDENSIVLIEIKDPDIKREYFDDPEGLRWPYTIAPKHFNAIIKFSVMKHAMGNEVESDIELKV